MVEPDVPDTTDVANDPPTESLTELLSTWRPSGEPCSPLIGAVTSDCVDVDNLGPIAAMIVSGQRPSDGPEGPSELVELMTRPSSRLPPG